MYDYIVIGSGSAGSTVAARLAEGGNNSVFVAEAGGSDRNPLISVPLAWGLVFRHRLFDWNYWTEPEPALNNRRIECARGRVVGGCSSVNGMVYSRGVPGDYDNWKQRWGLDGWSFEDVLPYFKKSENWPEAEAAGRGDKGPLHLTELHDADPLVRSFMKAVADQGFGVTPDYNGPQFEGFGAIQATIHQGKRWNTAAAYLRPAIKKSNVTLKAGILVTRILIEKGRATGIEFIEGNRLRTVHARREVILSAGVFNSPKLLMLSGAGPAEELMRHQIPVKVHLPGVGQNLHDHLACEVRWKRRDQGNLHRALRVDRAALAVLQGLLLGSGPTSTMPLGAIGLLRSHPGLQLPDVQLLLGIAPLSAAPYLRPFAPPYEDAFTVKGMLVKPTSRGCVRLRSADPQHPPVIEQKLLGTRGDLELARTVIGLIRSLATHSDMQQHIASEIAPGATTRSSDALEDYLRSTVSTLHHPVGTCRMGPSDDIDAVLDSKMRVKGVDGLRVVDASAMPEIPRGPINGPVIMMAEKAADLILESP